MLRGRRDVKTCWLATGGQAVHERVPPLATELHLFPSHLSPHPGQLAGSSFHSATLAYAGSNTVAATLTPTDAKARQSAKRRLASRQHWHGASRPPVLDPTPWPSVQSVQCRAGRGLGRASGRGSFWVGADCAQDWQEPPLPHPTLPPGPGSLTRGSSDFHPLNSPAGQAGA